jgi:1-aminocyclopropane-1-carboxylate deaminase/D-cysteine desulfhydrase-like pyridoxal-dependent ACC family enzyme
MIFNLEKSINQHISLPTEFGVELYIKREDRIHSYISGNKYRKLKYNLIEAETLGFNTLLTFGGAYSNHIAAVASVGATFGFKTIGIIRGEELKDKIKDNPTLRFAQSYGMQFKFVTRSDYREKASEAFIKDLKKEFGTFYLIPEGGTNTLAIKGCEEILTKRDKTFDYVCCAIGTGGTISGLINSSNPNQKVLGFPALKGAFLSKDISKFVNRNNWELITDYHFGGFAKITTELISFINKFKKEHHIPLDPIYTGKIIYGIIDMMYKNKFLKGTKILAIHTGGLQGIEGMNMRLKEKGLPIIE